MRLRHAVKPTPGARRRSRAHRSAIVPDLASIRVSNEEILADLHYPASTRNRATRR